jgi:hypothetical protein
VQIGFKVHLLLRTVLELQTHSNPPTGSTARTRTKRPRCSTSVSLLSVERFNAPQR